MIVIGCYLPAVAIGRDVVLKMRESWRDQVFYYQCWQVSCLVASVTDLLLALSQNGRSARCVPFHGELLAPYH